MKGTLRAGVVLAFVAAATSAGLMVTHPADDAIYYLVSAVNTCGPPAGEGWGASSLGVTRLACP